MSVNEWLIGQAIHGEGDVRQDAVTEIAARLEQRDVLLSDVGQLARLTVEADRLHIAVIAAEVVPVAAYRYEEARRSLV